MVTALISLNANICLLDIGVQLAHCSTSAGHSWYIYLTDKHLLVQLYFKVVWLLLKVPLAKLSVIFLHIKSILLVFPGIVGESSRIIEGKSDNLSFQCYL